MKHSTITIIIAGNTYNFAKQDGKGVLAMPSEDRRVLLELLESVKEREADVLMGEKRSSTPLKSRNDTQLNPEKVNYKDMGKGDLDALAAQLIMKEKNGQKPPVTKRDVYKWVGGFAVIVFLLALIL